MCKGFTVVRFSAKSLLRVHLALIVLAASFGLVDLAFGQLQTKRWEDNFRNRSRIANFANVKIDTTAGAISLLSVPDSLSERSTFREVASGFDATYNGQQAVQRVVDIDVMPNEDQVYLVTDADNRLVFTYNSVGGSVITRYTTPFTPADAFPYLESNRLKVLITGEDGRVIKVDWGRLEIEWEYKIASQPLLRPLDAVALKDRPEVLICDTGHNRLLSVDTTVGAIRWQFDAANFNMPADVEVVPSDPNVYLVTDSRNHRVVLVHRDSSKVIWEFGKKGQPGNSDSTLTFPTDADALPNGEILICDDGNNRLISVNRQKQIVFYFAYPLYGLTDADRLATGVNRDKTLVAAKDSPTATQVVPKTLAYKSRLYLSPPRLFGPPPVGRQVDFDFLRWRGITPRRTRIRLQLRTVNDLSDTTTTSWYGPTGKEDFYIDTLKTINPIHDGNKYYQFRAYLDTDSLLVTPELLAVQVKAHYFRSDSAGLVVSKTVQDSSNTIITAWRSLEFTTNIPTILGSSVRVDLLDDITGDSLATFPAAQQPLNKFDIDPSRVPILKGRQALRLRAILRTVNPFSTPQLLGWAIEWNSVKLGPSNVTFANANFSPVTSYRLEGIGKDSVYIALSDPNTLPLRDSVSVSVRSALTRDSVNIFLKVNAVTRAAFESRPGIPIIFAQVATIGNRGLEVRDRDTLSVNYVDPLDRTDSSTKTALIIRRVKGTIQIENFAGVALDSVSLGDSLFIRVIGETDQNLSPTGRDSIRVTVFDPNTLDNENLTLFELPDTNQVFNTGDFRNLRSLRILREGTIVNNGRLSVNGGDFVTARYIDPAVADTTEDFVVVRTPTDTLIVNILGGDKAFDFIIAPNPFRAQRHSQLNLRAQTRTGEMEIRQIEIYNLAGEKVRTIPGGQIRFGKGATIRSGQGAVDANAWWDLQSDDRVPVASGTYFAKIYARLTNSADRRVQEVSTLRKMVIIQ